MRMLDGNWGLPLCAAALCLLLGGNLIDLHRARDQMKTVRQQQAAPLEASKKVEAQLDALAKGTSRLAAEGNANARAIVETLRQNGVSISAK